MADVLRTYEDLVALIDSRLGGTVGSGTGDMVKSVYDPNNDGVVKDSDKLGGKLPAYYSDYNNLANKPTTTGGSSSGDMLKSAYDTTNNGVVDNSEKLDGQPAAYYRNYNNLIDKPTTGFGSGDMSKATYDNSGISGVVDDSERLGGQPPAFYRDYNNLNNKPTTSGSSSGDMLKSAYDTNNNGVVDNSEKLDGQPAAYYRDYRNLNFTPTAATTNLKYLRDYTSLQAAVDATSGVPTDLIIDAPYTLSVNTTTPANVHLVWSGSGLITVNAGITLTINSMREPGNRQIFAGAGSKIFNKKAVSAINCQWYMPKTEYSDITGALNDALLSCRNYENGGTVIIPTGNWLSSGGHEVYNYTDVVGVGNSRICFTADNQTMFKIVVTDGGGRHTINFQNFIVNGFYGGVRKNGVKAFVANADKGQQPSGAEQIYLLTFKRIRCEIVETAWLQQASPLIHGEGIVWSWDDCDTSDNRTAFRCESINSSQIFNNCRFHVSANGTIFDLVYTGGFEAKNCLFISSTTSTGLPNSGSTVLKLTERHNVIRFVSCQDEALEYFLKTGTSYATNGIITLENNLIQAQLQPSAAITIFSRENLYVWDNTGNYKANNPSATVTVYSDDDDFRNLDQSTHQTIGSNAGIFTAPSSIQRNRSGRYEQVTQSLAKTAGTAGADPTTPAFPTGRIPAFTAATEVNPNTNPNDNSPFFRMGVNRLDNGQFNGWEFSRDPASGNLRLHTNSSGGAGLRMFLDFIAFKSPTGQMRKLVLNDDGTMSNLPLT